MLLSKKQLAFVFLSLWFHVSLLDLMLVNFKGPVFLWKDNITLDAIVTHFLIAFISTLVVYALTRLSDKMKQSRVNVSERIWAVCSLLLVLSIGFVIY